MLRRRLRRRAGFRRRRACGLLRQRRARIRYLRRSAIEPPLLAVTCQRCADGRRSRNVRPERPDATSVAVLPVASRYACASPGSCCSDMRRCVCQYGMPTARSTMISPPAAATQATVTTDPPLCAALGAAPAQRGRQSLLAGRCRYRDIAFRPCPLTGARPAKQGVTGARPPGSGRLGFAASGRQRRLMSLLPAIWARSSVRNGQATTDSATRSGPDLNRFREAAAVRPAAPAW